MADVNIWKSSKGVNRKNSSIARFRSVSQQPAPQDPTVYTTVARNFIALVEIDPSENVVNVYYALPDTQLCRSFVVDTDSFAEYLPHIAGRTVAYEVLDGTRVRSSNVTPAVRGRPPDLPARLAP